MVEIVKKKLIRYKEMKEKSIEFLWLEEVPADLEKLSFYKKKEVTTIF